MKQQSHTRPPATRYNPSPARRKRKSLRPTLAFLLIALALASYHFLSTPPIVQAVGSPDVVISQIYGGGGNSLATFKCDYIELYNRGTSTVNLAGYSIQYAPRTATAAGSNFGQTGNQTNITSGSIAPGHYFLIQLQCGTTGSSLPTSDATGSINLAVGQGKVALVSNQISLGASTCPGDNGVAPFNPSNASIVDFVGYGDTAATTNQCYEGTGPAPSPTNNTNAIFRKLGGNTDTDDNSADFQLQAAGPRSSTASINAVAVDNSAQGCNFFSVTSTPSFTWNHTIGGEINRALIVGISTSYEVLPAGLPSNRVLSVTYNGQTMTRIGTIVGADTRVAVEMFRLTEAVTPGVPTLPAAGTYPVVVNLITPLTPDYAVGGSVSFYGVNQSSPNGTFQTATGTSTNPSVAVTSATNQLVIDTVATTFAGGTLLVGPGQTERWNGVSCFGGVSSIGAGSTEPGAATTTMSWTETSSQPWAIGAVSLQPVAPTAVELASFDAMQAGKGVTLRWKTGYEVDNLGFNVYREQGGKRKLLNPSVIAGSALMAGQGTRLTAGESYAWLDRSANGKESAVYWLEDIDLDGSRTMHGPISPISAGDSAQEAANTQQSVLLSQLNELQTPSAASVSGYPAMLAQTTERQAATAKLSQETAAPGEVTTKEGLFDRVILSGEVKGNTTPELPAPGGGPPVLTESSPAKQRALAAGPAVKIAVQQSGWYRVTQAELVAAGLSPEADPSLLQLYADGIEQPILISGGAKQLGAAGSIEFYGIGMDTPTSLTRTYWLVAGKSAGKRINNTGAQEISIKGSMERNASRVNAPATATVTVAQPAVDAAPSLKRINIPGLVLIMPSETSPDIHMIASKVEPEAAPVPVVKKAGVKKASKKKRARKASRHMGHASHDRRASSQDMKQEPSTVGFNYTWERKDRIFYFAGLLNGDADNFFGPLIMGANATGQELNINNLDKSVSGPATLEVALQGLTAGAHQVRVSLNGAEVGVVNFSDTEHKVARFQVRRTAIADGLNSVTLNALGGASDISLADYTRLTHWHTYRAENDSLLFTPQQTTPTKVGGFTSAQVRVFDVTSPAAVEQLNVKVSQQGSGYEVSIPQSGNRAHTLLAVADNQVLHSPGVTINEPSNWSAATNRADFVVLTHKDFSNAVKPLVELRRSQGFETVVVNVEDVYDEFSYGAHSRQAVKDFFERAKNTWALAPRYALLVGDTSVDPLNRLGFGNQDFVPTKLVDATVLETASDDALCDFDSDGLADISVGRLPVKTSEQAQKLVGKITGYSPGQTAYGALLVSDRQDGYDFEAATAQVRNLLPQTLSVTQVNRRDNPTDQVKSEIISGINTGPLLVNFAGHGSSDVWTGAGILNVADAASLTNGNRLPVFLMMTCLNGRFQDPNRESLAEALMKSENGGAVAVWASSGLTAPDPQSVMDQQFIRLIFSDATAQSPTLGDAVRGAKASTNNLDLRQTWILFGDPTMRIR
jgi:hypothetical protein